MRKDFNERERKKERKKFFLFDLIQEKIKYLLFFFFLGMDFNSNIMYYYVFLNIIIRFNIYKNIFKIKKNSWGWFIDNNLKFSINFLSLPNSLFFRREDKMTFEKILNLLFYLPSHSKFWIK